MAGVTDARVAALLDCEEDTAPVDVWVSAKFVRPDSSQETHQPSTDALPPAMAVTSHAPVVSHPPILITPRWSIDDFSENASPRFAPVLPEREEIQRREREEIQRALQHKLANEAASSKVQAYKLARAELRQAKECRRFSSLTEDQKANLHEQESRSLAEKTAHQKPLAASGARERVRPALGASRSLHYASSQSSASCAPEPPPPFAPVGFAYSTELTVKGEVLVHVHTHTHTHAHTHPHTITHTYRPSSLSRARCSSELHMWCMRSSMCMRSPMCTHWSVHYHASYGHAFCALIGACNTMTPMCMHSVHSLVRATPCRQR